MPEKQLLSHREIFSFLAPYRWRMTSLMALTIVLSILNMCTPLVSRAFIDRVVSLGQRELFAPLSLIQVFLVVIIPLAGFLQNIQMTYIGQKFVFDLRDFLYTHILGLSLRFFGKNSTGKLVNRVMGDSGTVARVLSAQTFTIISDVVCCAFAVTATFALNWRLAMLITLIVAIFVLNYVFNARKIRSLSEDFWWSHDRLAGGVQNRLVANVAVKSFGAEIREHGIFQDQVGLSMNLRETLGLASQKFTLNTALIQNLGRALLFFLGCHLVLAGEMTYGDVTAFVAYAMQLLWPAVRFSELALQLQDVRVALGRIFEISREKPEVVNTPRGIRPAALRGQIDFQKVNFEYEKNHPIIRDFDLHVAPGETAALVGPTGCGKSTLLLLLMRFYDVTGGRLLIDGRDVRDFDLYALRRAFGIVLQDPMLFNISIADNIRYVRPNARESEIEAAARAAEIHDFIMTLPDKYRTVIGQEGLQLSTGQKQRLTIARALLGKPAVMIMDEATSALDSESERAIQVAMERVLRNRTSFVVAHRLSTIRNASRIVLIKGGGILEMGTHDELMNIGGRYRALYNQHVGKEFIEDDTL
ncbi:MAG: ABC transporter ATP-binding protein [Kiritimatiellae bacterium]|nr:ABC transporter ATP-binding protein [Kiritimatiellia bacterium]